MNLLQDAIQYEKAIDVKRLLEENKKGINYEIPQHPIVSLAVSGTTLRAKMTTIDDDDGKEIEMLIESPIKTLEVLYLYNFNLSINNGKVVRDLLYELS